MKNLIIILFIILFFCCKRTDKKEIIIREFNTILIDSLTPKKNKIFGYSMHNIFIKGYVNDSIKINFGKCNTNSEYSFYLKDTIDKRFYTDYYGNYKGYFYFDSYKATKGRLEIKHSLD